MRSSSRTLASTADSGSSSSRTVGSTATARANAVRCCWPPDSWLGKFFATCPSPNSSSISLTRFRRWSAGCLRTLRPYSMLSAAVMFGNSAYPWKTMPMPRRLAGSAVTSLPSTTTLPASGNSNPAVIRSVVVLPHPDGPRKVTISPSPTLRSKSCTATCPPKRLVMPLSSRRAMGRVLSGGRQRQATRTADVARPARRPMTASPRTPAQVMMKLTITSAVACRDSLA